MPHPDTRTSSQPEAAFSDWFGVEVKRPADAPPAGAARSPSPSQDDSNGYPQSDFASGSYPSRPASASYPTTDPDNERPGGGQRILLGAATLAAGLVFFALSQSRGDVSIFSIILILTGLFRIGLGIARP